jgi:hypothetical protein
MAPLAQGNTTSKALNLAPYSPDNSKELVFSSNAFGGQRTARPTCQRRRNLQSQIIFFPPR